MRTIVADEVFLDLDFGYATAVGTALVGDFVWRDFDGDGAQDPDEPGIGGVTVSLINSSSVVVATTTTAGGYYLFAGVTPDTYTVDVTDTAGKLAGLSLTGPLPTATRIRRTRSWSRPATPS